MQKLLCSLLILTLLIHSSCGSEDKATNSKDDSTQDENSDSLLENVQDTFIETAIPELKVKLPQHDGSWIDDNLDNPVFYSRKVDSLVGISKAAEGMEIDGPDYEIEYLTENTIRKLNVNELIYYCLAFPASYSQICAEYIEPDPKNPKISSFLPFDYSGADFTTLQFSSLKERKKEVIKAILSFMEKYPERIHSTYLRLIAEFDAIEAIPILIKTASLHNLANYTALLIFIYEKDNEMLRKLTFYEELYGEEANIYDGVEANTSRLKEIELLAKELYEKYK